VFGWIFCTGCVVHRSQSVCHTTTHDDSEENLNKLLQLFWEVESIENIKSSLTVDESLAENSYQKTATRWESYAVRLPFKSEPELGESYAAVLRRLRTMERKFKSNTTLRSS